MISNRNLSIILLITGSVGISFGGLIMRNINNADPWQIAFYRALAFLFPITLILFHQYRLGIVTNIKKIGYPGMAGGFLLMLANLLIIQSFANTYSGPHKWDNVLRCIFNQMEIKMIYKTNIILPL